MLCRPPGTKTGSIATSYQKSLLRNNRYDGEGREVLISIDYLLVVYQSSRQKILLMALITVALKTRVYKIVQFGTKPVIDSQVGIIVIS